MKSLSVFIVLFTFLSFPVANAENTSGNYMEGHPSYNQNFYTPDYNNSPSTPNYDSNYYDRTYNGNDASQKSSVSVPQGNDIRDYNPYYDRDGNLK